MNTPSERTPAQNPFSTRCVRPGAVPFVFPDGLDAESLVQRLRDHAWRGQIVGPHGSGKSALLAALRPAIEQAGKRVALVDLHDGQRRLPREVKRGLALDADAVLVIDGYEQLGMLGRFWLARQCARYRSGLLVTAHASVGLPELLVTATTPALARRIVEQLLVDTPAQITAAEIDAAFARHQGDLRETLFALYDLYESRR